MELFDWFITSFKSQESQIRDNVETTNIKPFFWEILLYVGLFTKTNMIVFAN